MVRHSKIVPKFCSDKIVLRNQTVVGSTKYRIYPVKSFFNLKSVSKLTTQLSVKSFINKRL